MYLLSRSHLQFRPLSQLPRIPLPNRFHFPIHDSDTDGGTRTASINGAFVALVDALNSVALQLPCPISEILTDSLAAVSVGVVGGEIRLDLEYVEDRDADVDFNVVMTGSEKFIEVQGTGEEATFTRAELDALVDSAAVGIAAINRGQKAALAESWPR